MTEYRTRVGALGEVTVTRDDVAGLTRLDFRDPDQHTVIELPDGLMGPEQTIQLVNAAIRALDSIDYGHEVVLPEVVGGGVE